MRIAFLGSPTEALAPLDYLLTHCPQHTVVGVVSQPGKPKGRGKRIEDTPVAAFARQRNLALLLPVKARDPLFLEAFALWQVDVAVTCAYGQILYDSFLSLPKRATINIHPSLLPRWRGATPVQSSLLAGETRTGVSVLFTVRALDAGALIEQQAFEVNAGEVAGVLMKRLFQNSGPLLQQALERLEDPSFVGVAQDEAQVTHCQKLGKEDGELCWEQTALENFRRFQAMTPWPGAFGFWHGRRIVFEAMRLDGEQASLGEPGSFRLDERGQGLCIQCADGVLIAHQLRPAGARSMAAKDFWNGAPATLLRGGREDELVFDLQKLKLEEGGPVVS